MRNGESSEDETDRFVASPGRPGYVFSVMAYGREVLADLFVVRGHALKKCLFFRFAEGVRPYKPHYAGSVQFVKAADPEKQTLLRLDPLIQHRTKPIAITLNTYKPGLGEPQGEKEVLHSRKLVFKS